MKFAVCLHFSTSKIVRYIFVVNQKQKEKQLHDENNEKAIKVDAAFVYRCVSYDEFLPV